MAGEGCGNTAESRRKGPSQWLAAHPLHSDRGGVPDQRRGRGGCGIRLYGSVSSARWKRSADDSTHVGAVIPGGGSGLFCQLANIFEAAEKDNKGNETKEERTIAVVLDAGLAIRAIAGDVAHEANDTLRTRILGTDKRTHWGHRSRPDDSVQVVAGFAVETSLARGILK